MQKKARWRRQSVGLFTVYSSMNSIGKALFNPINQSPGGGEFTNFNCISGSVT